MPRLLIACAAALAVRWVPWACLINAGDIQKTKFWFNDFALVCSWDCNYYAGLATNLQPSAFFPLHPWLASLYDGATDVGGTAAVLFVSNLFAFVAGVLCLYVGERLWPQEHPRLWWGFPTSSWTLLGVVGLFAHSHFWIRGYPEPLFFCLLLLAVLALQRGAVELTGLALGLSAVTRPQGLFLLVAFGVLLVASRLRPALLDISWQRCVVAKTLAWLPFAGFLAWNQLTVGDAFYFLKAQKEGWNRQFDLLQGLAAHVPQWSQDYLLLVASLAAGVWLLRRPGGVWLFVGVACLLMAEVPLFMGGFYSYARFAGSNIGLFCAAVQAGQRWPAVIIAALAWSTVQLAMLTHAVGFLYWVG